MIKDYIIAETHYIHIRGLVQKLGRDKTHQMFEDLAKVLSDTCKLLPGMEHFELRFRNILERDMNPDGNSVFFTAKNEPESSDTVIQFNVVKPALPSVTVPKENPHLNFGE